MEKIHEFENGVKVHDRHLLAGQRRRYQIRNVHEEEEEDIFLEIIDALPPQAVYASVGTAIGYYALLARKRKDALNIHCFEPLPRHLRYLRENITLNGFDPAEFHIHEYAVSTSNEDVEFLDGTFGSSILEEPIKTTLATFAKDTVKRILGRPVHRSAITVHAIPMIQLFEHTGSGVIDFLQMDIQGFEYPVLKKYFEDLEPGTKSIHSFLIGTHGPDIHENCKQLLEANGYETVVDDFETKNQPDGILYCRIKA